MPQVIWPSPETRSPTLYPSTPGPPSTMWPTNSWPTLRGTWMLRCAQSSQFMMWRSVPQMPVLPMRINTSLVPTVGTGASSIQRPGSARRLTSAFIGAAPVYPVLSLAPSRVVPTAGAARRLSVLRELWPFLRPYRKQLAAALLLLSLGSATILLVPLAFRDLIDVGFGQGAKGGGFLGALDLNEHFLVLFGLAAFWALAVAARYYTVTWIGERVTADLRSAVYARGRGRAPRGGEARQTGEVLSRLTGDTTLIQTVVGSSVSMGLRSLFQFTGGMVMLAVTSFYLFSLNLGLMALLALPIFAIGRRLKKLSRESQDRIADASALAGEILTAMPTVQSYTQEPLDTLRFAARAETCFVAAIKRTRVRALLTGLIISAVSGGIIFVLWIGARQVGDNNKTSSQLASFILYAAMVAGGVGTIAE